MTISAINEAATSPQVAHRRRINHGAAAPVRQSRRAATSFVASLSIGAAVVHLAAASTHVEPLGDLALGFYWVAFFQAAFALALLARPRSRPLVRTGFGINLAVIFAWAWSRTIGLPMNPGGPEPVGIADATTVAFEIVLLLMLAARPRLRGAGPVRSRSATHPGPRPRAAFLVGIGLVVLATTFAMADAFSGHGHDHADGAAHSHPNDAPALTAPGPIETPHDHGGTTAH